MKNTALITGASSGIGLELAQIHASKGGDLILVARNREKLLKLKDQLSKEYGVTSLVIPKDLALKNASLEIYDEIVTNEISVDYLFNNAGFGDYGLFENSDWCKLENMINVNVTALAQLTRLFLPGMLERRSGKILNVGSMAGFQPGPTMAVYFATKAFVLSFSQAVNNEAKERGVTSTVLCPASTATEFHAVSLGDPGLVRERPMDPAYDVALYGYRAMMKGKPVAIYGAKNKFLVFASRFAPRNLVVKTTRRIQEKKNYMPV